MEEFHCRLDRWKEIHYLPRTFVGKDMHPKIKEIIEETEEKTYFQDKHYNSSFSIGTVIRSAKELIYTRKGENQFLYFIVHTIDSSNMQPCIATLMHTLEIDDEEVIELLAIAHVDEVPVFPNTTEDEEHLLTLYRKLYKNGFLMQYRIGDDSKKRFKLTEKVRAPTGDSNEGSFITSINFSRLQPPALAMAARKFLEVREEEFARSQKFVNEIQLALNQLSTTLSSSDHNEEDLQLCLARNPILFGAEYRRIISKPSLGSDYQLDFALENWNGEVHILEIEMSSRGLFTKSMRPTKDLIHAEQQVLDWISWISRYPSYAESKIPYATKAYGTIIIGRKKNNEELNLRERNRLFKNVFEILTYDDLLNKARHLLNRIVDG